MTEKMPFDRDAYCAYVIDLLRRRYIKGSLNDETDFLVGASAIFGFLDRMDQMPCWMLGPIVGKSVLGETCVGCHKKPADVHNPSSELCPACRDVLGVAPDIKEPHHPSPKKRRK